MAQRQSFLPPAKVENDKAVTATPEIEQYVRKIKRLIYRNKLAEKRYKDARAQIEAFMDKAGILLDKNGLTAITWQEHEQGFFQQKAFAEQHPKLYAKFVEQKPVRTFLVK